MVWLRETDSMQDFIYVTGMILKQTPVGEYDRLICLLTRERGKISAFVKGCRRSGSRLAGAANPFSFGIFKLYEGKNSYTVAEADIRNYFEELRKDYVAAYYGMYFSEIADYYTRENNDEREMMKLLYQSLRALCAASIPNPLVRYIFEIKSIVVNGEFPGVPGDWSLQDSTVYAVNFIVESPVEKLFTFVVSDAVLEELGQLAYFYCSIAFDREFKSLEVLEGLN